VQSREHSSARSGPTAIRRWKADLALVTAAFFFGTTFVVVQDAVDRVDPMPFLAVRFLIGGAVLAVVGRHRPRSPGELRHGITAGAALLTGYACQTVGLQYTEASTSAFLTYMLVVFVPVIAFVALRRRPHPATLVGIALALVGLFLLTHGGGGSNGSTGGFGRGELLTLGCAFAFAAHIVILGETAEQHDPIRYTCVQVTTVGVISLGVALVQGVLAGSTAGVTDFDAAALGAAAFTGVFATAVAFLAMTWAQRTVTPSRAALILLLEPVFAALIGALRGDVMRPSAVVGGALILVAVVVAEVLPDLLTAESRLGQALE
jgi:drug/metabolite transporter (DMT)-like permease